MVAQFFKAPMAIEILRGLLWAHVEVVSIGHANGCLDSGFAIDLQLEKALRVRDLGFLNTVLEVCLGDCHGCGATSREVSLAIGQCDPFLRDPFLLDSQR